MTQNRSQMRASGWRWSRWGHVPLSMQPPPRAPETFWFPVAVTQRSLWGPHSLAAAQPRRTKQPNGYSQSFVPSFLRPLLLGRIYIYIK